MKQKVVLFDIDYTLFNTTLFKELLYKHISQTFGLEYTSLVKAGERIMDECHDNKGHFDPEDFTKRLSDHFHKDLGKAVDEKLLRASLFNPENFEESLYPESLEIIEAVAHVADVGIFSKGHTQYQLAKISSMTHLLNADSLHVFVDKEADLGNVLKKYKEKTVYLVDDRQEVLYTAQSLDSRVITIWIKRGFFENQENIAGFTPSYETSDLKRIVEIISEN